MRAVIVLLTGAALVPAGVIGTILLRGDGASARPGHSDTFVGSEPPAGIRLPSFALRDDAGRLIRSSDLKGRVTLLTFLDTQCTESCPVIAGVVGGAVDRLSQDERRSVTAIAISTDPAGDTASSVRAFLARHRATGRLHYLVAPEQELSPLWERFQILSSVESGRDSLHSAPVRLYGRTGVWLATQHAGVDLTEANLVRDIRTALAMEVNAE